jgi:hypothetical protein
MHPRRFTTLAVAATAAAFAAAGCGGSSSSSSSPSSGSSGGGSPGALSAEANSAATGDIPDNQNFLTFRDSKNGFSMRYPEGWAQKRRSGQVTFQDKNNLVRVLISAGSTPTVAGVEAELKRLRRDDPSLTAKTPVQVTVKGRKAIKVVYTTRSAPNQVTGKRVTLMVDRYELAKGGKVAVVDLGTPKGVDNVDAYRLMIESFQWR